MQASQNATSLLWAFAFNYLNVENASYHNWHTSLLLTKEEPNFYVDPTYMKDSITLKAMAAVSFFCQLLSTGMLVLLVIYEKSGLAGHYRTVLNQLASNIAMVVSTKKLS